MLAHELGHAFGLPHPNGDDGAIPKTTTDIYSSPGSIMEADTPNPEYNTYYNCWIFTYQPSSPLPPEAACPPGPMVQTTFVDGQPVDGYIRPTPPYYVFSYAGDVGSEPLASPNWWQNPDIWNRRSNTSGGGRAAHEIPDKNSEENYLYVRITRQTRLSVPVTVQLFMMEKGIDTKLYSIGQIEFARTETTAPAAGYTDLSLKWSPKSAVAVLSDHNTDHCICAVISHIDEPPLNNTVTASWMHSRAGIYRGLAQRNLGDITISLSASSLGSAADGASLPTSTPHRIHLPWVQFVNPFEQSYPTEVIVDATQATDLSDLTIEIDGDGWHESLAPGTVNNVAFDKQMEPSARLVLRLSATIPPGLPAGSEMVIDLRFTLDGQVIGGYTHIIRVGSLEEATVQVLERLAGVLQHLASAFTLELATSAAKSIKRIIRSYGTQPERALEALRRRAGSIRDLANAIHASPEPEAVIIQRGLFELAGLVASAGQGIDPEQMLERIRGLVDRIQEPTGQVARRQQLAQAGNSEALVERPQRKFRVLKAE
ncbi:MAG: hypothetical protein HGB28_04405 [Oscillochloris sp.]|nr:hypothetical protein [Oscillochloris sp.]